MSDAPARAALFGGSFDPVHRGHLAMAAAAREEIRLDRFVFVPAAVSPFKAGTMASGPQRRAMLEIALREAGYDWAEISDFELARHAPSYSWETAGHYAACFPNTVWYWVLGTDQWAQIERWAEPERLRQTLHFLVFARQGQEVLPRPGWRSTAIPFDHPASSSAIREDFPAHRDWLLPGVAAYWEQEVLAQTGAPCPKEAGKKSLAEDAIPRKEKHPPIDSPEAT